MRLPTTIKQEPRMQAQKQSPVWRKRLSQIESPVDAIRLPDGTGEIPQDEEWCEVIVEGVPRRVRFHDYDKIYSIPGLYERLFCGKLRCRSPSRVAHLLADVLSEREDDLQDLRVLDLGAGNGMVGDELVRLGVEEIVGIDIIEEAKEATLRDRPGVYRDYLVCDLTDLEECEEKRLDNRGFNCLICVAALGFDDIPPEAFVKALDIIETGGWVGFSIKEQFLDAKGDTGFCGLIQQLAQGELIRFEAYRRFRHRVSITGEALYYVVVIARKLREIPSHLLDHETAATG
ncbi:MAG: class I SAM-dependent DNA methyltransferase [Acidobacteriota bacterium]